MSFFSAFTLTFGLTIALLVTIAAWLFRTSGAPLIAKLAVPALLTALACITPFTVNRMLGLPVTIAFADLPDTAELISFVTVDGERSVDLWMFDRSDTAKESPPPRAYETILDEQMKKVLRDAKAEMQGGGRVMLRKRGGKSGTKDGLAGDKQGIGRHGVTDIQNDDDPRYEIDQSAFGLPPKN